MPFATLLIESHEFVTTISLNRPEKRNAISPAMMAELMSALDEIERGPIRVAILSGEGKAFCAGMDLSALRDGSPKAVSDGLHEGEGSNAPDDALENARRVATLFRRIWEFPKPLIAAVHGPALAGGCALATFADITLASPGAQFGYTEVRIGFVPAIIAAFVVRQLGEKRARELLLSGRTFGAEEAQRMGLVNEVVPLSDLMGRARSLAQQLIALSPTSLRYTKGLLRQFSAAGIERDLEAAIEASAGIRATEDFREGLTAFLEKRAPIWKDR